MGLATSINQFLASEIWKDLESLERTPSEVKWKQFHHTYKGNSAYCDLPWLHEFWAMIENKPDSITTKIFETKRILMTHQFFPEDKDFTWEEVIAWLKDWSQEASYRVGKEIYPLTINVSPVLKKQIAPKTILPYFIHMIHNSLEHGIECPAMRQAFHKPTKGRLWLEVEMTDSHQKITFGDDGQGTPSTRLQQLGHSPCPTTEQNFHFSGKGLGLYGLTQQMSLVGGTVKFSSTPFQGFKAEITIPHSQKVVKVA